MIAVLDASVVVKWFAPPRDDEPDSARARDLLRRLASGELAVLQPPHWLAESAAVLTRLYPDTSSRAVDLLYALELPVTEELDVYRSAVKLARELDHHLFDTLYHAAALQHGGRLVTADDRYRRKALQVGSVVALADWVG